MEDENVNREQEHKDRLAESRQRIQNSEKNGGVQDTVNDAKNIAQAATPWGVFALLKEIDMLGDMPFFFALCAAVLKDIFNIFTFETVILPFITSICCGIFIYMMLYLGGAGDKKRKTKKMMGKGLTILFGSILDFIPGLDIVPIETITVLIVYGWVLLDRKNAQAT